MKLRKDKSVRIGNGDEDTRETRMKKRDRDGGRGRKEVRHNARKEGEYGQRKVEGGNRTEKWEPK